MRRTRDPKPSLQRPDKGVFGRRGGRGGLLSTCGGKLKVRTPRGTRPETRCVDSVVETVLDGGTVGPTMTGFHSRPSTSLKVPLPPEDGCEDEEEERHYRYRRGGGSLGNLEPRRRVER